MPVGSKKDPPFWMQRKLGAIGMEIHQLPKGKEIQIPLGDLDSSRQKKYIQYLKQEFNGINIESTKVNTYDAIIVSKK